MNKIILILLLCLTVVLSSIALHFRLSTISPGPEGLDVNVYGVYYRGELALVNDSSTFKHEGWHLEVESTKSIVLSVNEYTNNSEDMHGRYGDPTDVFVRLSRAQILNSWQYGSQVSWETEHGNEKVIRVGKIVPADFEIEVGSIPGQGDLGIKDVTIWLVLHGVSWRNLIKDPDTPEGYKLEDVKGQIIPIMAWAEEVKPWAWKTKDGTVKTDYPNPSAKDNVDVFPRAKGDELTLYEKPNDNFQWYWTSKIPSSEDLKEWLAKWSPDYRFRNTWYTKIRINYIEPHQSGNIITGITTYYPSTKIRVRVLCLVVGEFTYLWTKEEAEKQGYEWEIVGSQNVEGNTPLGAFFKAAGEWFSNPFNRLFLALTIILILIIMLLVFTPLGSAVAIALASRAASK